jgi:hypothetical protein
MSDEGGGGTGGFKKGFLNEEPPVVVPESVDALDARVRVDLAECERLRAVVDDEGAPYESRYAERRVLQSLLRALDRFAEGGATQAAAARTPIGVASSLLGNNFVDTEEPGAGSAPLARALETLGGGPSELLHRVDALNHMGMLCSEREQHREALAHLVEAKALYERAAALGASALAPPDLASCATPARARLERLHTHTLFYLAQVHGHLGEAVQSAIHAHATLRRQLREGDVEYEPHEWCKNAMQLATFYSAQGALDIAEHCLHAADRVLGSIGEAVRRDEAGALTERFCELRANIHLQWGELMRRVLRDSRQGGRTPEDASAADVAGAPIRLSLDEERLTFSAYLPDLPACSAECRDVASVASFPAAAAAFKRGLRHVLYAKRFFALDGYVTDHYACANLEAQLWGALALHETRARRALAMHARRAGLLSPLLDAINHKAYHSISRQMAFDLGAILGDSLDVKLLMLRGRSAEAVVTGVTPFVERTVAALRRFLTFFLDEHGRERERVDEDNEEVFVSAHFNIARAHSKLETKASQAASLRAYEFIVDYADKHKLSFMAEEVAMAREMLELLPQKLVKMPPTVST